MTTVLAPQTGLDALVDSVDVASDGRSATVAGAELSAADPRELERELGRALYERWHVGHVREQTSGLPLRDPDLEAALTAAVPHTDVDTPIRVVSEAAGGRLLVDLHGAGVWIDADRIVRRGDGVTVVRLPSVWPAISPGFFLAKGRATPRRPGALARVYVHVAEAAAVVDAWSAVVGALTESGVAWQSKVASGPGTLPRRDGVTTYVDATDAGVATRIAAAVADLPGVAASTSPFARQVGHGTGLAWEPDDDRPGRSALSFGQHRSSVIATALIRAARAGEPRGPHLDAEWRAANVDPRALWRNRNSPADI